MTPSSIAVPANAGDLPISDLVPDEEVALDDEQARKLRDLGRVVGWLGGYYEGKVRDADIQSMASRLVEFAAIAPDQQVDLCVFNPSTEQESKVSVTLSDFDGMSATDINTYLAHRYAELVRSFVIGNIYGVCVFLFLLVLM